MKLVDAKAAFLAFRLRSASAVAPFAGQPPAPVASDLPTPADLTPIKSDAVTASMELLYGYFTNRPMAEVTPVGLREFLSHWYLEEACVRALAQSAADNFPDARTLLCALSEFFLWLEQHSTNRHRPETPEPAVNQRQPDEVLRQANVNPDFAHACLAVLKDLQASLPGAIEITLALSTHLASRGGAFTFPEFLTSFEEGGHSEYDIGEGKSTPGAKEGYFKILRLDGAQVEGEELLTEERVYPILFPVEVARLLDAPYIINLELIRFEANWQIVNCGFAYPPGTDL